MGDQIDEITPCGCRKSPKMISKGDDESWVIHCVSCGIFVSGLDQDQATMQWNNNRQYHELSKDWKRLKKAYEPGEKIYPGTVPWSPYFDAYYPEPVFSFNNETESKTKEDYIVTDSDTEWCPTQGGTYRAYRPEYFDSPNWKEIGLDHWSPTGIPQPLLYGGINRTLGFCGYHQAMALAYTYAAIKASEGKVVDVRAQQYEVVYDLKARKVNTEVDGFNPLEGKKPDES